MTEDDRQWIRSELRELEKRLSRQIGLMIDEMLYGPGTLAARPPPPDYGTVEYFRHGGYSEEEAKRMAFK